MRFGENLIDTGGGHGADSRPFATERYPVRRMANGASVQLESPNISAYGGSIIESVLVSHQLEGNTKLASATTMVGGGTAYYAQSNGAKTYYRTNTVANGLNENDTNILDFEYWFPVDNAHNGHSVTGTAKTKGVYAPLAVADAKWDREMSNKEHARYGCYDSGQGCGSGTHELSISGSMVQSTETTPGTFSGYQVKDWNLNMNSTSSQHPGNIQASSDQHPFNILNVISTGGFACRASRCCRFCLVLLFAHACSVVCMGCRDRECALLVCVPACVWVCVCVSKQQRGNHTANDLRINHERKHSNTSTRVPVPALMC